MYKTAVFILIGLFSVSSAFPQEKEIPNYEEKFTLYSKKANHIAKNINLTIQVFDKEKINILINNPDTDEVNDDTLKVHELSYLPLANSIANKLISYSIGSTGEKLEDILEYQSLTTFGQIVLKTQAYITSYNTVNRDTILGRFDFKIKVPFYIEATSAKIEELNKKFGYNPNLQKLKNDSIEVNENLKKTDIRQMHVVKEKALKISEEINDNKLLEELKLRKNNLLNFGKQFSGGLGRYYLVGYFFIEEAELTIKDGIVEKIKLNINDSLETRYRYGGYKIPITKLSIQKTLDYNLQLDIRGITSSHRDLQKYLAVWKNDISKTNLDYWLQVSDVFNYSVPKEQSMTRLFVPEEKRIFFNAKEPKFSLIKETNINNVIKLNFFSDLVGIQEEQPNGLVQGEASFRTRLFAANMNKRYKRTNTRLLDHIEANLRFSKIEQKLRYLNVSSLDMVDDKIFIPNFQLLQYDNLEVGIKTSVLTRESFKRYSNLYFGLGIIRTGIRDTLTTDTEEVITKTPRTFNTIAAKYSLEANTQINATSYIGLEIGIKAIGLKLLDSDIIQSGNNYSRKGNEYKKFDFWKNIMLNPYFQAYYKPNQDESQRLYLRASFLQDIGTRSNNFLMVQLGFSSDINKILQFNNSKKKD